VSTDVIGNSHSSIYDSGFTAVTGGRYLRVLNWYDNEWGYSCRVCDVLARMHGNELTARFCGLMSGQYAAPAAIKQLRILKIPLQTRLPEGHPLRPARAAPTARLLAVLLLLLSPLALADKYEDALASSARRMRPPFLCRCLWLRGVSRPSARAVSVSAVPTARAASMPRVCTSAIPR
jgi:hypothetical protein